MRSATSNRKFLPPGLRHDIETSSHRLDNVYTVVSESLKAKVGKDAYAFVDTPVVYCTDLDNMIETVIEEIGGLTVLN